VTSPITSGQPDEKRSSIVFPASRPTSRCSRRHFPTEPPTMTVQISPRRSAPTSARGNTIAVRRPIRRHQERYIPLRRHAWRISFKQTGFAWPCPHVSASARECTRNFGVVEDYWRQPAATPSTRGSPSQQGSCPTYTVPGLESAQLVAMPRPPPPYVHDGSVATRP